MPKTAKSLPAFWEGFEALYRRVIDDALPTVRDATSSAATLTLGQADAVVPEDIEYRSTELIGLISKFPAAQELLQYSADNKIMQARMKSGQDLSSSLSFEEAVLFSGLGRCVYLERLAHSTEDATSEVIRAYKTVIHTDDRKVRAVVALRGITTENDPLDLDGTTQIGRANPEDAEAVEVPKRGNQWANRFDPPVVMRLSELIKPTPDFLGAWPDVDESIEEACRVGVGFLQLFVSPRIRPMAIAVFNQEWLPNCFGRVRPLQYTTRVRADDHWTASVEHVDNDATPRLRARWLAFRESLNHAKFRRAVKRYSYAALRDSSEDGILDALIGLEALFGRTGGNLADTIATRYALVVGKGIEARQKMRQTLKALYDVRSAIAHGDDVRARLKKAAKEFAQSLPESVDPNTVEAAETLSRWMLQVALTTLTGKSHILDRLDELSLAASVWQLETLADAAKAGKSNLS